jgi:hypothetical protein
LVVTISAAAALLNLVTVPVTAAPPGTLAGDNLVLRWNGFLLDAIRNSTLGPPMVARALAIAHTCMYDAWAAYDAKAAGTQLGTKLRRPQTERTDANKATAINYAAYRAAADLFPNRRGQLDAFMLSLGLDPALDPIDTQSPEGVGVTACRAVLQARHADMSNQTGTLKEGAYADWTFYKPMNAPMVLSKPIDPATVRDPDRWQPLTYTDRAGRTITPQYVGPQWGQVKPFALPSGSALRSSKGPAKYGSQEYVDQARALVE